MSIQADQSTAETSRWSTYHRPLCRNKRESACRVLSNRSVDHLFNALLKKAQTSESDPFFEDDESDQFFDANLRINLSKWIHNAVNIGLRVVPDKDLASIVENRKLMWSNSFSPESFDPKIRKWIDRVNSVVFRSSEQMEKDVQAAKRCQKANFDSEIVIEAEIEMDETERKENDHSEINESNDALFTSANDESSAS